MILLKVNAYQVAIACHKKIKINLMMFKILKLEVDVLYQIKIRLN